MIGLRILSEQGIEKFREYIQHLKVDPYISLPALNVYPSSSEFQPVVEIDENKIFSTKMEMGKYLTDCFRNNEIKHAIWNPALWTWLAYIWFDQLCPAIRGTRKIGETARYICSMEWNRFYRHLVASAYDAYSTHREKAILFLHNPIHEHNDYLEQFAARNTLVRIFPYTNIIEVAYRLYWNIEIDHPKRGAQSRNKPGNHRRFVKIMAQLELTYDVYSMTPDEILNLLPEEFDSWKTMVTGGL